MAALDAMPSALAPRERHVASGIVYIGSADHRAYAIDAATGKAFGATRRARGSARRRSHEAPVAIGRPEDWIENRIQSSILPSFQ
jgi:hypothetical protein